MARHSLGRVYAQNEKRPEVNGNDTLLSRAKRIVNRSSGYISFCCQTGWLADRGRESLGMRERRAEGETY